MSVTADASGLRRMLGASATCRQAGSHPPCSCSPPTQRMQSLASCSSCQTSLRSRRSRSRHQAVQPRHRCGSSSTRSLCCHAANSARPFLHLQRHACLTALHTTACPAVVQRGQRPLQGWHQPRRTGCRRTPCPSCRRLTRSPALLPLRGCCLARLSTVSWRRRTTGG
jgi:hypothetical protein